MATRRRSNRVAQTSLWVWGGEGQIRDLFPFPPLFLILIKIVSAAISKWKVTALILAALAIYFQTNHLLPTIAAPIIIVLIYQLSKIYKLYYDNPDLPLIKRKTTPPS